MIFTVRRGGHRLVSNWPSDFEDVKKKISWRGKIRGVLGGGSLEKKATVCLPRLASLKNKPEDGVAQQEQSRGHWAGPEKATNRWIKGN